MPSLGVMRFAGLRALKMILELAFVSLEGVTEVVVVVSGLYWILIFVEGLGDGVRVVFVRGLYCSLGSTDTEDDLTVWVDCAVDDADGRWVVADLG